VNVDGTCNCLNNWQGNNVCSRCTNEYVGKHCQFSRGETCFGHGTPIGQHIFPSKCKCDIGYWGIHCRHTEREFLEKCVASPTRTPEKCCGTIRWTKWTEEEEKRISKFDTEVRKRMLHTSVCDNVWGVWRNGEATMLTGVPSVTEVRSNDDWVETHERGVTMDQQVINMYDE
tara:strand:+ start:79 stop:597 length:519 start_codon:yes stop_codon:yes gene_type:complete